MKKSVLIIFLIFIVNLCSSCTKTISDKIDIDDNKSRIANEADNTICDCNNCPDMEPYIEEHNTFHGSNSQMIYWGEKTIESLYKRYDDLCNKIIENFKEDKVFIEAFKKDIEAFKAYRESQFIVSYPHLQEAIYGLSYKYAEWDNNYSLTVGQIERTRKNILEYCNANSTAVLKNKTVCSKEHIDELFDNIKLKDPKPIISTPYDK